MSLGRYNTYFGNGSAVTSVYDVETGEHRPTVLADGEMAARLCDALPQVDFVMAYAHPGDFDPHVALLQSFRAMVKNTTKPLCVVAENKRDLAVMTEIAAAVRGGADGARRQAVLRPLPRADQRPEPPGRQPRQAALLRRPRHPGDLLAGAAGGRHGADHHRRADRPGHGRVAARPGHPPAAQAGRAVPLRHRPGRARHGDLAELVQRARVPDGLRLRGRAGALARPAQLGLRRHHRRAGDRRAGGHGGGRADLPQHGHRVQPEPRPRLPRLRHDRVAGADRADGRVPRAEPQALRRRRGDAGDAGRRRGPRRRPRRRLPRPPPHRQERAQGAVAADDHQPPGPRPLGRKRAGSTSKEKARLKALKLLETHEPAPLPAELAARIDALVDGFTPEG